MYYTTSPLTAVRQIADNVWLPNPIKTSGTVWIFLDVLNGAYGTAGLEGRMKGIGLNKIVIALHGKICECKAILVACSSLQFEVASH